MSALAATTTSLPTSRAFLTSLLTTLSSPHDLPPTTEELSTATTTTLTRKPTLLTLHALFPTSLLPALDLLDRHLITRLVYNAQPSHSGVEESEEAEAGRVRDGSEVPGNSRRVVYYVKSNTQSSRSSRYGRHGDTTEVYYEVRTQAWSCSCAAFAFATFNGSAAFTPVYQNCDDCEDYGHAREDEDVEMLDAPATAEDGGIGEGADGQGQWDWGGLMLGEEEVLICKHLLACVLSERWDIAGGMVEEREVGKEEMAGWAAGWGG